MKRIGCVGDNCVDHYRQTGEDHFGGNPVNVAVYTRRLGGGISYVGAVGTDAAQPCWTRCAAGAWMSAMSMWTRAVPP